MKKEVFDIPEIKNYRDTKNHGFLRAIKKELQYIGLMFLIVLISFKIAFYKEEFTVIFRNVISLFWIFALPGYFIMLYWEKKLGFTERFIIGSILAAGIIGILSYYLGLIGLNIKYHTIVLPLVLILVGVIVNMRNKFISS